MNIKIRLLTLIVITSIHGITFGADPETDGKIKLQCELEIEWTSANFRSTDHNKESVVVEVDRVGNALFIQAGGKFINFIMTTKENTGALSMLDSSDAGKLEIDTTRWLSVQGKTKKYIESVKIDRNTGQFLYSRHILDGATEMVVGVCKKLDVANRKF